MTILFFFCAYVAEVIGTMAGFGSSTVFLPLALLFLDFPTALVLVAFHHVFGNITRINFFKSSLDKKLLLRFGLPSVVLTFIGALLVPHLNQNSLKGILGIFLVIYSAYSLWKDNFSVPASTVNDVIGGSLSGFLAGLIGTGGALRGAFLTGFGLQKEKYIATAAAIALAVDLTRIPVYLNQGFLTSQYYWYLPVLFALALAGSYTGKQMIKRFPQKTFKKIVLVAILISGLKFILDTLDYS